MISEYLVGLIYQWDNVWNLHVNGGEYVWTVMCQVLIKMIHIWGMSQMFWIKMTNQNQLQTLGSKGWQNATEKDVLYE